MALDNKIDDLNAKILSCLQHNARESFASIGKKIGLTPPAVAERIKKMEDTGVIEKYNTVISATKMGYQLHAIVMVRAFAGKLKPVLAEIKNLNEVMNCYRITGNENIIMEVVFRNQFHLEKFIDKLIRYGEVRTHIILSSVVSNAPIEKVK